jgi:serine/threonine protein kinase
MATSTEVLARRYRLGRLIGQGGMSDVYAATDERHGTQVAVKIVRSGDPELARRLAQEARALERVEHPGLVRLLDTGITGSQAYLVMELIDGRTLAHSLREGPLGPGPTATLGAGLADALAYVHGQGIVHRDVKPSNILLDGTGKAQLGDFGIARLLDGSTLTLTGTTLGTAAYMAPEQLEDHQVGPGADIWSLGMVLLECLTGRRVYEGSPGEVVARRLAGPVPLPATLPVAWKLVLSGMLDHRPEQRLQGAEVAALLATSPFHRSWDPDRAPVGDGLGLTVPQDLTALVPGAVPAALLPPDDTLPGAVPTAVVPPVRTPNASATAVLPPAHTILGSSPLADASRSTRRRRWGVAGLTAAVVVALCVGLILGIGSNPASHRTLPPHVTGATHPAGTSATSTTPTTTTTTVPTGPTALAALVGDLASGEAAGTIDSPTSQSISTQAQQAVSQQAAGNPSQAANDLQQAAAAIADGVQNGNITQAEATTLQADLSTLAATLGLSAASTPPTTAATPAGGGGGAGNGHGKGKGD